MTCHVSNGLSLSTKHDRPIPRAAPTWLRQVHAGTSDQPLSVSPDPWTCVPNEWRYGARRWALISRSSTAQQFEGCTCTNMGSEVSTSTTKEGVVPPLKMIYLSIHPLASFLARSTIKRRNIEAQLHNEARVAQPRLGGHCSLYKSISHRASIDPQRADALAVHAEQG